MPVENQQLLDFNHRLEQIVDLRDTNMAAHIHKVLQEASPNDRLFFAVGYSTMKYFLLSSRLPLSALQFIS